MRDHPRARRARSLGGYLPPTEPLPLRTHGLALAAFRAVGVLPPSFADIYYGFYETREVVGSEVVTELRGPVRDQAELIGVLTALYNHRLPIILVERITTP
jgi:hypothetical protein